MTFYGAIGFFYTLYFYTGAVLMKMPKVWETEGQLAFLREQGCDEMQGYLFS